MKKLLVALAVISLTGSVASAQKVHSDNQDIRFTAGVRIPIEHSRANSGEVMSLTYGKYNDKGFGFHGGVQWMFENMDINDYLGLPLSVSWSSGRRTFKQTLEDGLENFAGCAVVISHDRWFLDRIATHILAYEGDSNVVFFEGNYAEYEENRKARLGNTEPKRFKYKKLME